MKKERRKEPRITLPNVAMAVITGENIEALVDSGVLFGKVKDISNNGARADVNKKLSKGDLIKLTIRMFRMDLDFFANVVYSQEGDKTPNYVGLEFDWNKTSDENKVFLRKFLEVSNNKG